MNIVKTVNMSKLLQPKLDLLGRELIPGQFVTFCQSNRLFIGRIKKVGKKMLKVQRLKTIKYLSDEVNKYPEDCFIIDEKLMTWWLIKNA